jgi:arabinofuranosyltransferase
MMLFLRRIWAGRARYEAAAWFCTALMVALCIADFSRPIEQADDAYISFRYALNLANGHGLVFNPGEYVEGFTNLLWTLLIAAFISIGVHAPAAAQLMSVTFAAASMVLLHIYVRRFLPRALAWFAAAAPLVLLASNSFASWMTTGLETPLFLFLTLAALLAFDAARPLATAWICVLCLLCRPEGGLLAAIMLGLPWLGALRHSAARALRAGAPPLIFACALLAVTVARWWYYGDIVPNTFHAKIGQAPVWLGAAYAEKFLWDGPLLLVPGALIGAAVLLRLRVPMMFVLASFAYAIAIGGDVFAYGRFLLPTLPVLLAGTAAAIAWAAAHKRPAAFWLALSLPAAAVISLFVSIPLPVYRLDGDFNGQPVLSWPLQGKRNQAERHYLFARGEKKFARALGSIIRHARPGVKTVACFGIGKLSYYNMDFDIIDMVGLTDRHVAQSTRTIPGTFVVPGHSRTDSDYILSRRPDVIMLPLALAPGALQIPAEVDLLANPRLPQDYRFVPDANLWVRKN